MGEGFMRDIRSDLLERVALMERRIKAAHAHCEDKIKQLQNEHDAVVANLKSSIAMLAKLIEFGPLSKDDLCNMAMKEGYFPDAQSAAQDMEATLMRIVEEKRICPL